MLAKAIKCDNALRKEGVIKTGLLRQADALAIMLPPFECDFGVVAIEVELVPPLKGDPLGTDALGFIFTYHDGSTDRVERSATSTSPSEIYARLAEIHRYKSIYVRLPPASEPVDCADDSQPLLSVALAVLFIGILAATIAFAKVNL